MKVFSLLSWAMDAETGRWLGREDRLETFLNRGEAGRPVGSDGPANSKHHPRRLQCLRRENLLPNVPASSVLSSTRGTREKESKVSSYCIC